MARYMAYTAKSSGRARMLTAPQNFGSLDALSQGSALLGARSARQRRQSGHMLQTPRGARRAGSFTTASGGPGAGGLAWAGSSG